MLSSHLVADLERVCDYLVVLVDSRVRVAGDVDELLATPPPAHRPAPRPGHAPGRPAGHLGQPHRPADHAARAHRRPDPRPGLDGRRAQPGGPGAGLHEPGRGRRRPDGWRCRDDLADLAAVPHPGRRGRGRRRSRSRSCSRSPGRGWPTCTGRRLRPADPGRPLALPAGIVVLAVARRSRRVLGRAAGRPRAGGRHPPAGVDPERDPRPVAGDQARARPARGRGRHGRAQRSRSPGGRHPLDGLRSETRGSLPPG